MITNLIVMLHLFKILAILEIQWITKYRLHQDTKKKCTSNYYNAEPKERTHFLLHFFILLVLILVNFSSSYFIIF